jgi:hypothetical protein
LESASCTFFCGRGKEIEPFLRTHPREYSNTRSVEIQVSKVQRCGDRPLVVAGYAGLVHLQERFWAMNYVAAYELAERTTTSLVNAHKASLSIAQKVS